MVSNQWNETVWLVYIDKYIRTNLGLTIILYSIHSQSNQLAKLQVIEFIQ